MASSFLPSLTKGAANVDATAWSRGSGSGGGAGKAAAASAPSGRAVGGRFTMVPKGRLPPRGTVTTLNATRRKRDPHTHEGSTTQAINEGELDRGILSCVERGLIPATFDMSPVMAGKVGGVPLAVGPMPMHRHIEQFRRHEIQMTNMGFAGVMNVVLDIAAVERAPTMEEKARMAAAQKAGAEAAAKMAAAAAAALPTLLPVDEKLRGTAAAMAAADAEVEGKAREDARKYTELLDLYSLHEFIIRKGQALRNTPEFASYQRTYVVQWGAISHIIALLEQLLLSYGVPLAYVDGKKVAVLASVDLGDPTKEELLSCIANRQDVEPLMVSTAQQFRHGTEGHHAAAARIQSLCRMWRQRNAYLHLKEASRAATLIQRQWNVHKAHVKTRKTIAVMREGLIFRWRQTMAQFVRDWSNVKNSRRMILHVPSLSYPTYQIRTFPGKFFNCFQGAQLPRLCDLQDPNVDVIIISPFRIETETVQYYHTTLKSCGVHNPEGRVMILVPELSKLLPDTLSLTKQVLLSSKLMKVLTSLVRGKTCYMVPGVVGQEELLLAAKLNIPMLAPEPKVASVLGSKSGAKAIFDAADVITPVGAHSIREERDLYNVLARCITEYPEYPRWLIKLDFESGGRGIAFLDVRRLTSVAKTIDEGGAEVPLPVLTERIVAELREHASKRIRLVNSTAYPEWQSFVAAVHDVGCCVEAAPKETVSSPVVNLFIEPDGTVNLTSIQEQIVNPQYCAVGVSFPQTGVPHDALRDAALAVGAAAYRKRVMGYVTIDFVVHRKREALRLWAVDLDLRLTTNAVMHNLAMLMGNTRYDGATGGLVALPSPFGNSGSGHLTHGSSASSSMQALAATSPPPPPPAAYVYSGLIYHTYIGALRHAMFFNLCRQKGLSFDTYSRSGIVFHLVDNVLCGCIGVMGIGATESACLSQLSEVVDFIQQQLTKANVVVDDHETNLTAISRAIRNMPLRGTQERRDRSRRRSTMNNQM